MPVGHPSLDAALGGLHTDMGWLRDPDAVVPEPLVHRIATVVLHLHPSG